MTTDEMTELKPCPFCGDGNIEIYRSLTGFIAVCGNCNLDGAVEVFGRTRLESVIAWNTRAATPADTMPTEGAGIGSPEHKTLCEILSRIQFHYLGYRSDEPSTAYKIFDDCYQALRELEKFAMELVANGRAPQSPAPVTDAQRGAFERREKELMECIRDLADDLKTTRTCLKNWAGREEILEKHAALIAEAKGE